MIYLIDDKTERQKNLGWTKNNLTKFQEILTPISTVEEITRYRTMIFSEDSIILYHESFFDNPLNYHKKNSLEIKQELIRFSDDKDIIVVFFSGSIGSRTIENKRASLPVNVLYQNLESFLDIYKKDKLNLNINQIVFGKEYKKEKYLIIKNTLWNLVFDKKNEDMFVNNAELSLILDDLQKKTSLKLKLDNITNEYFKFQLNKIQEINE